MRTPTTSTTLFTTTSSIPTALHPIPPGIFFGLILFNEALLPLIAALGTTPLMLAVVVGAAQNVLSKSAKYSLFDPCKEMAYIPLDAEEKTKGKAAIDVIGNPLGKSGGSFLQQMLLVARGSLARATPILGGCLMLIVGGWLRAAPGTTMSLEWCIIMRQSRSRRTPTVSAT